VSSPAALRNLADRDGPPVEYRVSGLPSAVRVKRIDGGLRLLARYTADSPEHGLAVALTLFQACPGGFHPWRVEIQKHRSGRRAFVTVSWQRNARRGPER